jgi:hypothetical protein
MASFIVDIAETVAYSQSYAIFLLLCAVVFVAFELLKWVTVVLFDQLPLARIAPGGRLRHTRDLTDYTCEWSEGSGESSDVQDTGTRFGSCPCSFDCRYRHESPPDRALRSPRPPVCANTLRRSFNSLDRTPRPTPVSHVRPHLLARSCGHTQVPYPLYIDSQTSPPPRCAFPRPR